MKWNQRKGELVMEQHEQPITRKELAALSKMLRRGLADWRIGTKDATLERDEQQRARLAMRKVRYLCRELKGNWP